MDEPGIGPGTATDIQFIVGSMEREIVRQEMRAKWARRQTMLAYATTIIVVLSSIAFFYSGRNTIRYMHTIVGYVEDILEITKRDQANQKALQQQVNDIQQRVDMLEKVPHSLTLTIPDSKGK